MSRHEESRGPGLRDAPALYALLGLGAFVIGALSVMQDDSWWHLRGGQWILQHRSVPAPDPFSWMTEPPRVWQTHSWLGQVLFYAVHAAGGLPLLELMCGALHAAALCFSAAAAGRPVQRVFPLALAALPWLWAVASVRAHVFSLAAFSFVLWLLSRRQFWPLPLVFAVWANLHGAVALGGLVMVIASAALLVWERPTGWRLLGCTALCGLATLLNPMGVHFPLFLLESVGTIRTLGLVEWMGPGVRLPQDLLFWLYASAILGFGLARARHVADPTTRMFGLVALAVFVAAATTARNVPFFLLAAVPFCARLLPQPARPVDDLLKPANLRVVLGAAALVLGVLTVAYQLPLGRLRWEPFSPVAQERLRALPDPIFNTYNTGGYLLWFFPERRVFIDSRFDPYELEHVRATIEAQRTGEYSALFAEHGFRSALLERGHLLERELLRHGWRALHEDAEFIAIVRPD